MARTRKSNLDTIAPAIALPRSPSDACIAIARDMGVFEEDDWGVIRTLGSGTGTGAGMGMGTADGGLELRERLGIGRRAVGLLWDVLCLREKVMVPVPVPVPVP